MSIDFSSGSNSLFPRLGRLGKLLLSNHGAQSANLTIDNDELGRFTAADMDLSASFAATRDARIRSVAAADLAGCQQIANGVLIRMVAADQPTRAGSIAEAMVEVVRQMKAGGVTVKAATVGSTVAAFSGVTGSQVLVVTTKRGDGRDQELLVAEAAQVRCTRDSRSGGLTAGEETFDFVGVPAGTATASDYDWPLGSGVRTTFLGASALLPYPRQNRLVNSGFDGTWVSTTPPNWTKSGTIVQETTTVYGAGQSSVKVNIGQTPILTQTFNDAAAGTAFQPSPLSSYPFCIFARALTSAPTAGVLRIELWSTGGVVNDDTGSPARVDFTLSTALPVANVWTPLTGVLRTPAVLPAGLSIRVNVQTASDVALFYDHFAVAAANAPYSGGPGVAVFAGDVAALQGDGWTVTLTNNRGGASFGATFNTLFDRLFGMRTLVTPGGLLLPTNGAPTIPDSLISA